MKLLHICLLLLTLGFSTYAASVELREFSSPEQEQRFRYLSKELRCLVCQNQSLSDSDADLAKDLRNQIHKMLQEGASNDEILDYMVERYGDFVLYEPPVKDTTLLLWFGPFLLIGFVSIFLIIYILKRTDSKPAVSFDVEEHKKRIQAMMENTEQKDKDKADSE